MNFDDVLKKIVEAEEQLHYQELRERGIIADGALIVNRKHMGVLEDALFEAGIKRIPIIYTDYIEDDIVLFVTDPYVLRNIKEALCWKEEGDEK